MLCRGYFYLFSSSLPSPTPALPSPTLSLPSPSVPTTVFTRLGSQARLRCPQQPGFLIQYYSIVWSNSSSNTVLATYPRPPNVGESRYLVDEATLDLLIDEASLLDSDSNYQCHLKVFDPQDNFLAHPYPPSDNITLTVYGKCLLILSFSHLEFRIASQVGNSIKISMF